MIFAPMGGTRLERNSVGVVPLPVMRKSALPSGVGTMAWTP
jgi:hypothetical protein